MQLSFSTMHANIDDNHIATLYFDVKAAINKLDDRFISEFSEIVNQLCCDKNVRGIVITSQKSEFCVGADLALFANADLKLIKPIISKLNSTLRLLETCGKPIVAAINGSAIGGGYEIALACHRRILANKTDILIGLPEVNWGLLPGGGGTQRLPRLIGIQPTLELILQGKLLRPEQAKQQDLVDEVVSVDDLVASSKKWILQNPTVAQPWDLKQKTLSPSVDSVEGRNLIMATVAAIVKKTAGIFLAPQFALSAIQEGMRVTFDRSLEIEARYFYQALTSRQAKNMLRTLWFHKNAADKQEEFANDTTDSFSKIGIIGAGMMGAGIAFACAKKGFDVVLQDISDESLKKGIAKFRTEKNAPILERIQTSTDAHSLEKCDLIIEAVFEDSSLKHRVTRQVEPLLPKNAVWASNTSAIPITDLANSSERPNQFIGLHFFSPAEKMPLVEIIVGKETSRRTLASCVKFVKQIGKTPIIVGDGYGFFTSRIFCAYILEATELVAEGHDPVLIEWAARKVGMVVSPLQVLDEVSLTLITHAMEESRKYRGKMYEKGIALVQQLVELGRTGKAVGKGFYDYADKERNLWSGLETLIKETPQVTSLELLMQRLLYIQLAEVLNAMQEGIIRSPKDAEIGAIFGIGFAPFTGGPLSILDDVGISTALTKMTTLSETYGPRYTPAPLLFQMAKEGKTFW